MNQHVESPSGLPPFAEAAPQGVLERITDGFLAFDANFLLTYINGRALNLLEVENRNSVIGQPWLEAFPRAKGTAFERNYLAAMREQRPVHFIEFSRTSNVWFEVNAYPSLDGISVFFRDITARVEADRALARTHALQDAQLELARMAIAGFSVEEIQSRAVRLCIDALGARIAEIRRYDSREQTFTLVVQHGWGDNAQETHSWESLPFGRQLVEQGGVLTSDDVCNDPRFDKLEPLATLGAVASVGAILGSPENPFGFIVAFLPDKLREGDVECIESFATTITQAMRNREATRNLRGILESIQDAFTAVDADLKVMFVNKRMSHFYGIPAEELIGRSALEFLTNPGEEKIVAAIRSSLRDHKSQTVEYFSPAFSMWVETRFFPWAGGVAIYVRDVTARKNMELEIRELNIDLEQRVADRTRQLKAANKELESFAYSVSHDLRAPLRAIDGFSQVIEEDYSDRLDETGRSYIVRVRKAARRMAELIDALLDLARIARRTLVREKVDISALASAVAAEFTELNPERTVDVDVEPGLSAVGDPTLIRTIFENLVGNAWKFTRHTNGAKITIGRTNEGEFFVRDNGAGFDMKYADKLFGAFQRLHTADEYEGTGIGLATVARVVHRHGGMIRAQGEINKGAAFYFTLPMEARNELV